MENNELATRLKNLRLMRGYSVNQVAKLVERAPNTIINWESGKGSPDVDIIEKLCSIYKIKPNQMFGWEPCEDLDIFVDRKKQILLEIDNLQKQKAEIEIRLKNYQKELSRRI